MSLDQQPHDSMIWLGFSCWMRVFLVFHVCVIECHCDVKDYDVFAMTMFWVTMTGGFRDCGTLSIRL